MKYPKQMYRLLVVVLVVVAFSLVSVVSPAHAETLSATDQAAADSTLESLEAQAAAAGIGVRTVNGVKVFHTRDGQDLEMVKICNGGGDAVKNQGGEVIWLETALQWELRLPISTEVVRNLPGGSNQRQTLLTTVLDTIDPVPYAQNDSRWGGLPLGWGRIDRPTIGAEGCFVTCTAMEAATYGLSVYYSDVMDPGTMNAWLVQRSGFSYCASEDAYNDLIFEAMTLLPGIYGVWNSNLHFTTVADVYATARDMIAGTFSTYVKPSLPIVLMSKSGVPTHFCAWYGSNGTQDPTTNLIVQPTLHNVSNTSLECTFVPGGNNGYSPSDGPYLMRVACWRK
jgi:hypothetical protein